MPAAAPRYPCPCCGYLVFVGPPGGYEICPICWWEDDAVQLRWPEYRGGANGPSLIEAQQNYAVLGTSDPLLVAEVRPPHDEKRDPEWRPIKLSQDPIEPYPTDEPARGWPADFTSLYYWRAGFWRRPEP